MQQYITNVQIKKVYMKFENTKVYNFDGALRGMRNPLQSWDKSDSKWDGEIYIIGENDLKLAKSLIKGGAETRKFLRQIFISVDITAPRYWWQEYSTYKIGTTEDSESTMHRSMKQFITEDMFVLDKCDDIIVNNNTFDTLNTLNYLIKKYNETHDITYFRLFKQKLPEGFLQMRTCTMNYENIYNMRNQRKNHKLSEWKVDFMNWSDELPYANEFFD